ncbi:MAG TPA: zinc-dependent metalloprotease family protein, partial [Phycisphaerae bacterium]|nr:zinc-dependent metalloprotease family protein [Phycisphaerae bacterium]
MIQSYCWKRSHAVQFYAVVVTALSSLSAVNGLAEEPRRKPSAEESLLSQKAPLDDASSAANSTSLVEQAKVAFGLTDAWIAPLQLPPDFENSLEVTVPIDSENLTLELWNHSVRASHFKLLVQVEDGSYIEEQPAPERTLRGFAPEYNGSVAAGSLLDDGLYLTILLGDGREYWVEPLASKLPLAAPNLHVVYRAEDVLSSGGSCATEAAEMSGAPAWEEGAPRGAACGTGICFAELATDADFEYFQDWGSTTAVQNRIQLVVNSMNVRYEQDVDITHVVSAMVVRTSDATDPYTSTQSNTLVGQVRTEWNTNLDDVPRDLTQLFTGKEIAGSTIGQAFNIAIVCTDQAYSYAQSDCCGSLACATVLHAHENGHVWGGFHCNPCGATIMSTPLECSATSFSAVNITEISNHRDSRTCLATGGAGLTPPFVDDFPTTTLDATKWNNVVNASSNSAGNIEPSAPNSLNIDGNDSITSVPIDLTHANPATFSYWWQRTGSGDSPENGEDLNVEYLNNLNAWTLLVAHPGQGSDTEPYQFATHTLPADARHAFLRLRFRGTSTATNGTDDFFVDDVNLDPGDIFPPAPNPMAFLVAPAPSPGDSAHELSMEAVEATDATGPVQYFFQRTNGPPAGNTSGWQTQRTWLTTGLAPNTTYALRVKARDNVVPPNETAYSSITVGHTAIETPTGVSTSDAGANQMTLTATGPLTSLASSLSGLFFEVLDPLSQPAGVGANIWTQNSLSASITVTGLSSLTTYSVRVKARNRSGVETPFTSAINVATIDALFTPGAPTLSGATATTLQLTIDVNGNTPAREYAIQCTGSSPADPTWDGQYVDQATGAPVAPASWETAGDPVTVTQLNPNVEYQFAVKARNAEGTIETSFGPESSAVTMALTPAALSVEPSPLHTAVLNVVPDADPALDNSTVAEFAIRCAASDPTDANWAGKYASESGHPSATAVWRTDADWGATSVNGLQLETAYEFQVKARNQDGIETPFGEGSLFTTGSDCNANAIADAAELAGCGGDPACADCNQNGRPDSCDLGLDIEQWASQVIDFSSQFPDLLPSYGAIQAIGEPDVSAYADSPLAWTPAGADDGLEHITVGFDAPVFANGAVVRENYNNGFVVRLDAVKLDNSLVEVWPLASGQSDDSAPGAVADFTVTWSETSYLVKGIRVTIDTTHIAGDYEEIDAIKLLGRTVATESDADLNNIPDSCEQATGACCVTGSCGLETENGCATLGGEYLGDDSVCEPSPCAPECLLEGD